MVNADSTTERIKNRIGFTKTLGSVAKVIGGNVASNLISVVTSILIARWVGPYSMGVWNAALLITLYTPTLQLGVFNGLNRELPYLVGTGDKDRAMRMAEAAYAWSWVLVGMSLLCGALVALWFWIKGEPERCLTSIAIAVMVVSSWPTLYLTTTYRTRNEFGRLAKNTVVVALVGAVLVVLVWKFHYHGLILRAALVSVLGVLALYYRRPLRVKPLWGFAQLVQLAKVGIPIWFVGQLFAFFTSMDRLMLVKSTEVLGYFTISIQVGLFVRQIPLAFGMVLYPQMAHSYGENHSAMDIWRLSRKAAFAAAALGLVAGVCGWLLLPTFVRLVLPKYVAGVRAAQWAGFLGFAMGFYLFDSVYNVIKRQDLYFYNWCAGCTTFLATWYCLTQLLHVPLAVASSQSMLVATVVMAIVSAFVGKRASMAHDLRLKAQESDRVESIAPVGEV